jgi:hypothetical protein
VWKTRSEAGSFGSFELWAVAHPLGSSRAAIPGRCRSGSTGPARFPRIGRLPVCLSKAPVGTQRQSQQYQPAVLMTQPLPPAVGIPFCTRGDAVAGDARVDVVEHHRVLFLNPQRREDGFF